MIPLLLKSKGQLLFPLPGGHFYLLKHLPCQRELTSSFSTPQDSIDTCPPLDILLVGGPLPDYRPSPAVQKFVRTQYEHVDTFITICSGFIPALYSGILDGKVATAPRELLPELKKEAPQVKWAEKRWTRDGKLWTSGSVANGQQLMVAYLREKFPKEIVDLTLGMSDIADRGQEFGEVLGH